MFRLLLTVQAAGKRVNYLTQQKKLKMNEKKTLSTLGNKFKLPSRCGTGEESVWVEYNKLAALFKPKVNLGQGFPDYHCPDHLRKALADIATSSNPLLQQYTRSSGHPKLVQALSKLYSKLVGREINPLNEILVSIGAYEALYACIMGHIDNGDEVIIMEPFFDCYDVMVKMAGGIPKFIALKPQKGGENSADWVLDKKELENIFSDRTKMIILNTPHNPLGKVFDRQEMELIAELCKKHNVMCLCDEVYEWLVYDNKEHIRMATLPGMWERTVTVGSAGKTFSVTGWKIGWAYGPANLISNMQTVHQNSVYTCSTPLQEAIAQSFELEIARLGSPECYFKTLPAELTEKRNYIVKVLKENGFKVTVPEGGYFIIADWTSLDGKLDLSEEKDATKDYRFTKKFSKDVGILTIPTTAFYSQEHKSLGENYIRICFNKKDEVLQLSEEILKEWYTK